MDSRGHHLEAHINSGFSISNRRSLLLESGLGSPAGQMSGQGRPGLGESLSAPRWGPGASLPRGPAFSRLQL